MLRRSGGRCPLSLLRAGSSAVRAAWRESRVQASPGLLLKEEAMQDKQARGMAIAGR